MIQAPVLGRPYGYAAADSGWAFDPQYWVGPGNWAYKVIGSQVTVLWSPQSRKMLNEVQGTDAADAILAELKTSGKKYSSQDAAVSAAQKASGAAGGGSGVPFYESPWFIGGTAVVVLGAVVAIVFWPKKKT